MSGIMPDIRVGKKSQAKEKRYISFTETPNLKRGNWIESILARVLERFGAYESKSPLKMLLYLLVLFVFNFP